MLNKHKRDRVESAYDSHKPNFRGLNNRPQIYKIVTKEHVYRTKICGGLDIFFSNTARFGEMTLGFLSRLAYNSGVLCKFAKRKELLAKQPYEYWRS